MNGQEIKSFREFLGLSQERFAHLVDATTPTVSRWENNHRKISRMAESAVKRVMIEKGYSR